MKTNNKIGIDLVLVSRIKISSNFINHLLTNDEQKIYKTLIKKQQWLAGRWALKEALFKVIGPFIFNKIGIFLENNALILKDKYNKQLYPDISLSLSHDGNYCVAVAMRS